MASTALTQQTVSAPKRTKLFVTPLLERIKKESAREFEEMQTAFSLLGWGDLPDELKIEIYDDVRYMVKELNGYYSSCDEFVKRRRQRVHYWVENFREGICTKETAIQALKVKPL